MFLTEEDKIVIAEGIKCPFCGKKIEKDEFRNQISVREWRISRLCQKCQDEVFGKD